MGIPKNWDEITIEQFQECYFLLGKSPDFDTWVMVLSSLSGESIKHLESIPRNKLKEKIYQLQFLLNPNLNEKVNNYVAFNGKPFKACLDASQMQTNQITDLKAFMVSNGQSVNDTIVENAHNLLACIYVPLTLKGWKYVPSKHKEYAQKFKKVKMGQIYGTLFFYSKIYKSLMETTNTFLESQREVVKEHLKEVDEWLTQNPTLMKDGGGR